MIKDCIKILETDNLNRSYACLFLSMLPYDSIVIIKNMFRLITCRSGAVKEYFFIKQDPAYRPVASKRHLDGTTAELPVTTCLSAGWSLAVCRAKTLVAVCH
jgi:hypothetical protein